MGRTAMSTATLTMVKADLRITGNDDDTYLQLLIEEGEDAQLDDFKSQLSNLLEAEMLEQKKSKIMLRVIEKRLEEVAE